MIFLTISHCTGYEYCSFFGSSLLGSLSKCKGLAFSIPEHITIPVAVSVFPDEIYAAPKSWAEKAYPKLIYFNKHDKGGHFAAWEQPQAFNRRLACCF